MQVTQGTAPQYVDKNVRFRTTYFFRVFDYCYDVKAASKSLPVADSLYRFVMTGQGNPYANSVNFESGTLTAAQIDPFGASVEPDKETGRPRFVSQQEMQLRNVRSQARDEIESLIELRQRLVTMNADAKDPLFKPVDDSVVKALDKQIETSISGDLSFGKVAASPTSLREAGKVANQTMCPEGTLIERGFQIMGPQGVRTYNQDERLIMAMSSKATGLLDALSQVSGRVLQRKGASLRDSDALLALVREQLRVSELRRLDDGAGTPTSADDVNRLIDVLSARLTAVDGATK